MHFNIQYYEHIGAWIYINWINACTYVPVCYVSYVHIIQYTCDSNHISVLFLHNDLTVAYCTAHAPWPTHLNNAIPHWEGISAYSKKQGHARAVQWSALIQNVALIVRTWHVQCTHTTPHWWKREMWQYQDVLPPIPHVPAYWDWTAAVVANH